MVNTKEQEKVASPLKKMDAFQFMMNSRHKSIGGNSEGRELELNTSADTVLAKRELRDRKSKLEAWADKKGGAAKRKRDEEIENCIQKKLEKRGRRFKKMLNVQQCDSDDEIVTRKRKKRPKVIESDNEDEGVDAKQNERWSPSKIQSWKFKIKLSMEENEAQASKEESVKNDELDEKTINAISENDEGGENGENNDECINRDETEENGKECEEGVEESNEEPEDKNTENGEETSEVLKENEDSNRRVLRSRRTKPKSYEDYVFSDSEEESDRKKKKKVAPVFLKAVPKPKLDPEVYEARRKFLMSGVPSSLKKELEKQQSIEDITFDVFPSVSHVEQKTFDTITVPNMTLKFRPIEDQTLEIAPFCQSLLSFEQLKPSDEQPTLHKVNNCKTIIKDIKAQNPDYPVYKIYNSFSNKTKNPKETKTKRRGRPKKHAQVVPTTQNETDCLWTEKYKPHSSTDILGNYSSVASLKQWLAKWTKNSGSDSDFDSDSCDSTKTVGSTVILKGPTGSGKTAAVYAVCEELGLNILEVNASSKRTGKRLVQELQEATQSHQVCKTELFSVKEPVRSVKKCVLFVEDVDLVFEQDEGFTAALCQIMTSTKRPVILTTTDEPFGLLQKMTNPFKVILFSPLSSILTIWLQIVCLIEGFHVETQFLDGLLTCNRGDIRRTLLQLQLLVESGGKPSCQPAREFSFTDLETVWWNIPSVLKLPKVERQKATEDVTLEKNSLKQLTCCYDTLAFADILCRDQSVEPKWRSRLRDGSGLAENMASYTSDISGDVMQTLLSKQFRLYNNGDECKFNRALPTFSDQRWYSKNMSAEEKLKDAVMVAELLGRKALALDYMPILRNIARSELQRSANNNKRGNRFYNYLRNLGICASDSSYKLVCDVFKTWD